MELKEIIERLVDAKKVRGRLSQIAADSGLSYRTIYGLMNDKEPKVTARTTDKLTAYFKKVDRRSKVQ